MWRTKQWIEEHLGIITLKISCDMCSCQHKIHWSVVAIIVNAVCLVMSTTGVATDYWAVKTDHGYSVNTGLFQACTKMNNTCYDTHTYFASNNTEKRLLIASAIMNVFSLIGFYLFFALSIFFLCGLYAEKTIATGAIVVSYSAGMNFLFHQQRNCSIKITSGTELKWFYGAFAIIGVVLFAVAIKKLSFSLSWSFILAVLGFVINFAAGVLMCVGRNISTPKRKKNKKKAGAQHPIEDMRMEDTGTDRKKIWSSRGDGPEVSAHDPDTSAKFKY